VQFAGAGFPPVIVHRAGEFTDYASGGPPLGILAGIVFDEYDIALDGGTLYAFSDGATDVRDGAGRPIDNAGVRKLIVRHAAASPDARLRGLLTDLKRLRLVDDTTLLIVEAPRAQMPEVLLERRFAAQAAELRSMRSAIRQALDILAVEPELRDRLVLAVDEACANIIRHGYGPHHEGDIGLRILRDGPVLSFELTDAAPCVDPASIRPKPLGECRSGGFGIALIDEVMDDWRIQPAQGGQGNLLILRKRIDGIGSEEASEA
jgi:sigma-B regulation protein RsbU (phosphoserine phosphatase)